MKYTLILLAIAFASCNKERCYQCVTNINGTDYPAYHCDIDKAEYEASKTKVWYDGKDKNVMKTECK